MDDMTLTLALELVSYSARVNDCINEDPFNLSVGNDQVCNSEKASLQRIRRPTTLQTQNPEPTEVLLNSRPSWLLGRANGRLQG